MPKHIGLIGGIGPAATDFYYQRIISSYATEGQKLDLTIAHADASTLLKNLAANDTQSQVEIYQNLTRRLVAAGAERVIVTSIAGHFCINEFKAESPLPIIDLIECVNRAAIARKLGRVGILGTETVMRSHFYGGLTETEAINLPENQLQAVHAAYVAMATSGAVNSDQLSVFQAACDWFVDVAKVDAVMLGGTDLAPVYSNESATFPNLDCAAVHVDEIVADALHHT